MTILNINQVRTLAFNAVGRGAETVNASAYKLALSNANSGISIGFMQWDFNQRAAQSNFSGLTLRYNQWATENNRPTLTQLDVQNALTSKNLNTNGITELNLFLPTESGRAYVTDLEDKSFAGTAGIRGLYPAAQNLMNIGFVSSLGDSETRIVLAGVLDVFNRNPSIAGKLISDIKNITTMSEFRTLISNLPSDLPQSSNNAIQSATLINRLESDQTFIGQNWRNLSDQTLRGIPTYDTQILDAMMRDPVGANALLDRLATGGTGKAIILLSGTAGTALNPNSRNSIWSELPFVGMDANGNVRIVGGDGNGASRVAGSTAWSPTQSSDPGLPNYLPKIEYKDRSWKFKLADGTDLNLGDTAVAQVNINGTEVTLDSSTPGKYEFTEDGTLFKQSQQGSRFAGQILTGDKTGATYTFVDNSPNPSDGGIRRVSFDGTGQPSQSDNYVFTLSDGKGGVTQTVVTPVLRNQDGYVTTIGTKQTTSISQGGVTVSVTEKQFTKDPGTGNAITSTDVKQYNPTTGALQSHTLSTNSTDANGNPTTVDQSFDASGAQLSKTVTTVSGTQTQYAQFDGNNQPTSNSTQQTFDDGTQLVTVTYPGGKQTIISTATDNTSTQVEYPNPNNTNIRTTTNRNAQGGVTGTQTITPQLEDNPLSPNFGEPIPNQYTVINADAEGKTISSGTRDVNPITGASTDTITPVTPPAPPPVLGEDTPPPPPAPATIVTETAAPQAPAPDTAGGAGTAPAPAPVPKIVLSASALNNLNLGASILLDVNIITHSPTTAGKVVGVLNGTNNIVLNTGGQNVAVLSNVSNAIGGFTGIQGLSRAWKAGDVPGVLLSANGVASSFGSIYALSMGYTPTAGKSAFQWALSDLDAVTGESIFGGAGSARK